MICFNFPCSLDSSIPGRICCLCCNCNSLLCDGTPDRTGPLLLPEKPALRWTDQGLSPLSALPAESSHDLPAPHHSPHPVSEGLSQIHDGVLLSPNRCGGREGQEGEPVHESDKDAEAVNSMLRNVVLNTAEPSKIAIMVSNLATFRHVDFSSKNSLASISNSCRQTYLVLLFLPIFPSQFYFYFPT